MKSHVERRWREGERVFYLFNMGILMRQINSMVTGDCFGELALLSMKEEELRQASVLCTEDTEFVVLDRQSFSVLSNHLGTDGRDSEQRTSGQNRGVSKV